MERDGLEYGKPWYLRANSFQGLVKKKDAFFSFVYISTIPIPVCISVSMSSSLLLEWTPSYCMDTAYLNDFICTFEKRPLSFEGVDNNSPLLFPNSEAHADLHGKEPGELPVSC